MSIFRSVLLIVTTLLVSVNLISCSNSRIKAIERSGGYEYRPGYPEVRLVASSFIDDEENTWINLNYDVVYASIVFKKVDQHFEAELGIELQIVNESNPLDIIDTRSSMLTLPADDQRTTLSQNTYSVEESLPMEPGRYSVRLIITDLSNSKQTVRQSEIIIPDPTDNQTHVTNIQVYSKENTDSTGFKPVTTYDLSSMADSVRFVFQITNNNPDEPIIIDSRLIKFESDTSYARPLSWPNYSSANISYRGINYGSYEEITSSRRVLTQPGSVFIEFVFPKLSRGNYRFEVSSELNEEENNELYKGRDFSIKSPNYPSLRTARELAAPLIYIMNPKDYDKMMEIKDDVELKKAVDRFWLSKIKNTNKARNVIALYYERVEEANKQFANFKEGWKTDMGMMYILFGPPRYITKSLESVVWSYSNNLYDPETNFGFRIPKTKSKFFPFDHYVVYRDQQYYSILYQQIEMWLSGDITRDNL